MSWTTGGDYDAWKTTEPEPFDADADANAREEALLNREES